MLPLKKFSREFMSDASLAEVGGGGTPLDAMSILSFNYMGLGNTIAVNNLRNLVQSEAPSLIF